MLVHNKPKWPAFGATETKLRYDAPISLLSRETSQLSSMLYSNGWAPHLKDVVVSLPNGSRFVFWRGSSYVPFWAGRHNTGLSYEWAETGPLPEGFVDSVEPLMDGNFAMGECRLSNRPPLGFTFAGVISPAISTTKFGGTQQRRIFTFIPTVLEHGCCAFRAASTRTMN